MLDFARTSKDINSLFEDMYSLDFFFLQLQQLSGVKLYEQESVIIFDEVQLLPKARQAIKYLVEDGRYKYIETGSLLSIRKNTKDILIPSEEHKIDMYPMDFEEFLWAIGDEVTADNNLQVVDETKREIIDLYVEDFTKIDGTGLAGDVYDAIPASLSGNASRYVLANARAGIKSGQMKEVVPNMLSSYTVLISYHANNPSAGMSLEKDANC